MVVSGDGTHSRGGPDFPHLTFTQKSKCGGGWWKPCQIFDPHQRSPWLKNNDDNSVLLYKKERKNKRKYI
jgi:hypothetical protein